ncbi:MAG: endonuclease/exonuclease/phosphatase family protein [Bacteroidia bacterium]|nr:endonuclease/exonuclease/phosphatase family protein [Bacteroidia bacterium]
MPGNFCIFAYYHQAMRFNPFKILIVSLPLLLAIQQSCKKIPLPEKKEEVSVFDDCITPGSKTSFEIVTLNLEGYPKKGEETVSIVQELINKADPDIIAFQEIASENDFSALVDSLDGWESIFYTIDESPWNLAYIIKSSEIENDDSKTRLLFSDDSYAFPRPPFEIFITHKSLKISLYLINIHLKCCGGTVNEDRRRDASEKLQSYLTSQRMDDPVIVLGDYNDDISGKTYETNVFYNLASSASDYLFTDMGIALGSPGYWSYPSYPSHIDHILITDELFSNVDTTMVLMPDKCYPGYRYTVSDHRPVEIILK